MRACNSLQRGWLRCAFAKVPAVTPPTLLTSSSLPVNPPEELLLSTHFLHGLPAHSGTCEGPRWGTRSAPAQRAPKHQTGANLTETRLGLHRMDRPDPMTRKQMLRIRPCSAQEHNPSLKKWLRRLGLQEQGKGYTGVRPPRLGPVTRGARLAGRCPHQGLNMGCNGHQVGSED